MIYNVKTIEYLDSVQVRTYRKAVQTKPKITTTKQKINNRKKAEYERTKKQIDHSIKSSVNRTVNQIYAISRSNRWFLNERLKNISFDHKTVLDE